MRNRCNLNTYTHIFKDAYYLEMHRNKLCDARYKEEQNTFALERKLNNPRRILNTDYKYTITRNCTQYAKLKYNLYLNEICL